jgi:3-hydroxyacyl-CoA dehydrogenase/enoyl-CoA hydratase/3-hydroxybutyryl-CoA epimerase/3-hydroxyacyl-CoA dehydrogenase/enoyl-CoA hydratase/3-hydroxybutyryl-CoA epimerase/enoyl-CoA isomerase
MPKSPGNLQCQGEGDRQGSTIGQQPASSRKIRSVGIIGAGMMGTAIAAAHVRHHLPVVIHDADEKALGRAMASIAVELDGAEDGFLPGDLDRFVHPTAALADVGHCDLVIESIVESLAAKQRLYAQLQGHLSRQTIVTSNSSTIPVQRLVSGLAEASRFCGMHFCHPVRQRPLVEIVRGPQTSPETIAAAIAHVRGIARIPIVVEDGPGFAVNRLLFPYLGEALEMLREGRSIDAIEEAAADFGMALGPLRLMDEIGLDTTLQAAWVLATAFPERVVSSPLLVSMVKAGRLGQKTGGGFFSYRDSTSNRGPDAMDTGVSALLAPWIDSPPRTAPENIACRLVLPMLLEATRLLEEGKVHDPSDIDAAALFGLGFPAAKGGLLRWADQLGAPRVVALLQSLATMGPRAEPTPLLRTLAETGGSFYPLLANGAGSVGRPN